VNVKDYQKLVDDNVCSTCKKAIFHVVHKINTEAKLIASKLDLENKIEQIAQKEAFITLKDHKPNFAENIKCRLINLLNLNLA